MFFAILFFIVKYALISIKYLIKFGTNIFESIFLTHYVMINKSLTHLKNIVTKTTYKMSL